MHGVAMTLAILATLAVAVNNNATEGIGDRFLEFAPLMIGMIFNDEFTYRVHGGDCGHTRGRGAQRRVIR